MTWIYYNKGRLCIKKKNYCNTYLFSIFLSSISFDKGCDKKAYMTNLYFLHKFYQKLINGEDISGYSEEEERTHGIQK